MTAADHQRRARGLRFKFMLLVTSVFFVMGLVLSTILLVGFQQSSENQLQQRGLALAVNLAAHVATSGQRSDASAPMAAIGAIAQQSDVAYVSVLDRSGTVIADTDPGRIGQTLTDALTRHALRATRPGVLRYTRGAEAYYDVFAPLPSGVAPPASLAPDGAGASGGAVRVGMSLRSAQRELTKYLLITISLLGILTGSATLIALFFVRLITAPLERMTEAAGRMAAGDFTRTIGVSSRDEVGVLADAFSRMAGSVTGVIRQIQDAAHQITAGGDQMLADAARVGEGAVQQAAAAESTSSSIAQMNGAVRQIAENVESVSASAETTASSLAEMSAAIGHVASSAVTLSSSVEQTASAVGGISRSIGELMADVDRLSAGAEEATASIAEMAASVKAVGDNAKGSAALTERVSRDAAELGLTAVERTIGGMDRIRETVQASSHVIHKLGERMEHVGKILAVVDDVTEQTTLLALNAAILAAQAGEHGKGFAVVAAEIKSLADRTASSTKEIAGLIHGVQSDTRDAITSIGEGARSAEEGVGLSIRAREALAEIVQSANRSSDMSRQIEAATLEQAQAAKRVAELVEAMNGMVRRVRAVMKEHEKGVLDIARASEAMRSVTRQVKTAAEEQAAGSREINEAMENVAARIQAIASAMNEQKRGHEAIMKSMVQVHEVSQSSVRMVEQMNRTIEGLIRRADVLKGEVNRFSL